MGRLLSTLSFVSLSLIVTACGNMNKSYDNYQASQVVSAASINNPTEYMPADEQCSENPNINSGTQTYQYRACRDTNTSGGIKFFPADGLTKSVCVVPAYNGAVSASYYQCASTSSAGSEVSFGSLNFNGVYIVNAQNLYNFFVCSQSAMGVQNCAAANGIGFGYGSI